MYSTRSEKATLHSLLLSVIKILLSLDTKTIQTNKQEKQVLHTSVEDEMRSLFPVHVGKHMQSEISVKSDHEGAVINRNSENPPAKISEELQEQLKFIKEEKDKEIKKIRHKLLEELDRLHLQERSLQLELEQERKELKREKDALFNEREKIKEKELLFIKEQENKFEKKIRETEEIHIAKLHSKDKEIEILNTKLQDKEQKLAQIEFELSSHRDRFDSLKRELHDINHMYKTIHEKYNSLLDENTNLVKRFEKMSDYNIVKEELTAKSRQARHLEQQIEKLQNLAEKEKKAYTETVTNLDLKLRSTEPQLRQMQKELDSTKNTFRMEEVVWNKEKKKLEQETFTLKELYNAVLERIEEQKQDIHDLHQTIHILHYQLTNKEVNHLPKMEIEPLNTIPKDSFFTPKTNKVSKCDKSNITNLSKKYKQDALNITADYKSKLNKLQKEIDAGYDKYSLIYCSALDSKIPTSGLNFPENLKSPAISSNFRNILPSYPSNSAGIHINQGMISSFKTRGLFDALNDKYSLKQFNVQTSPNTYKSKEIYTVDSESKSSALPSNSIYNIHSKNFQNTPIPQMTPQEYTSQTLTSENSVKLHNPKNIHTIYNKPNFNSEKESSSHGVSDLSYPDKEVKETISKDDFSDNTESNISTNKKNLDLSIIEKETMSLNSSMKLKIADNTRYSNPNESLHSVSEIPPNLEQKEIPDSLNITSQQFRIAKNVTDSSERVTISDETINNVSIIQPTPVIDLDAAWKRKTSLPSIFSPQKSARLQNSPSKNLLTEVETNQRIDSSSNNLMLKPIIDSSLNRTYEIRSVEKTNDSSTMPEGNIESNNTFKSSNISASRISRTDSKLTSSTHEFTDKTFNFAETMKDSQTAEESSSGLKGDNIEIDEEEQRESYTDKNPVNTEVKQTPEDSLSELSEVHLSCGSEQEQKEESDNW